MGRPPKPTALAKLQGNPGKRALPDDQPVPPKGEIAPPPRLAGRAKKYFVEFAAMLSAYRPALAYPADTQVLARYCETLVDYEDLVAWKRKVEGSKPAGSAPGLVYTMRTAAKKGEKSRIAAMAHMPQAKEIRELKADLVELERELGLTPKARSTMRVRAVQKQLVDTPTERPGAAHWHRSAAVLAKIGEPKAGQRA